MRNSVRFFLAVATACVISAPACVISAPAFAALPAACTSDDDREKAIAACSAVVDSAKSSKDDIVAALKERARHRIEYGEKDAAKDDVDAVLKFRPKDASLFSLRARAREDHDSGNAIADMDKAIELSPNNADYYVQRAKLHVYQSQGSRAESDFSEAIKLDPKTAARYMDRFSFYGEIHEYEKALADVTKAVDLGATDHLQAKAQVLMFLQRFDIALAELDKYASTDSFKKRGSTIDVAITYGMRGFCNMAAKQVDKAVADYSKAISSFDYGTLRQLRGNAFVEMKQYELAIQDYSVVLKNKPDEVATLYLRARAYELNNQHKEALADRTSAAFYSAGLKATKKSYDY